MDYYDNLLKIVLILSGIGKRSRRGCGSFYLIERDKQIFNSEVIYKNIQENMKNLNVKDYYKFNSNQDDKYMTIIRDSNYNSLDYPYVEEINLSKNSISEKNFYEKIKNAIDNCRNKKSFISLQK